MNLTGEAVAQKPPKPLRSKAHIAFVKSKPCLICGRRPSEAHHIRLGLRTMGKRVCDSKTVPLCQQHHADLHFGNEEKWWSIWIMSHPPFSIAAQLWHERTGEWPEWHSG